MLHSTEAATSAAHPEGEEPVQFSSFPGSCPCDDQAMMSFYMPTLLLCPQVPAVCQVVFRLHLGPSLVCMLVKGSVPNVAVRIIGYFI